MATLEADYDLLVSDYDVLADKYDALIAAVKPIRTVQKRTIEIQSLKHSQDVVALHGAID